MSDLGNLADLGAQVAIVLVFIWYLVQRNGKLERALGQLHKQMEIHLRILIKMADTHDVTVDDLLDDYDKL